MFNLQSISVVLAATLALTSTTVLAAAVPASFYLVTTTSRNSAHNSSHLNDVSALSLFDPLHQNNYLLRTIGPGYGSLPTFSLSNGDLDTLTSGPSGGPEQVYMSLPLEANEPLQFYPGQPKGKLSLEKGYLLAAGGSIENWSICEGPFGEQVVTYKGTGSSCVKTFLQAVQVPPY